MTIGIRFDNYLESYNTDILRPLAAIWGKTKATRKNDMIAEIKRGLADPRRVAEVVGKLSPMGQAALALMRTHAGRMQLNVLATSLVASGYPPRPQIYETIDRRVLRDLQEEGLIIPDTSYATGYAYSYPPYVSSIVICDERLLEHAGKLMAVPFTIEEAPAPADVHVRRPITVTLDMIAFLQAIENMNGIQLNKNGSVRVGDTRKLSRVLGWAESDQRFDGLLFYNPIDAFIEAFEKMGLLIELDGRLLVEGAEEFAQQPTPVQILNIINAFLNLRSWSERGVAWSGYAVENAGAMRNALLMALSINKQSSAFLSVSSLSNALFERVARSFSLIGMTHPHYEYPHMNTADKQRTQERYDAQLRVGWQRSEEPWIQVVLSGWLYFLGMVEIGLEKGVPSTVRLSELGSQVLRPQAMQEQRAPNGPAWMVQPDFEVIVYLDNVAPMQLSFLERIAERVQIQSHMARYRLTRESVYQALERGVVLDDLLNSLTTGAGVALPQNVSATLRDWGAQRDKVTLYRFARLLELPSQMARDALLSNGIAGTPIGERYIRVGEENITTRKAIKIDYTMPLPPALKATEDGHVTIVRHSTDILLKPMLDRWAEPQADGSWQFTSASVASVTKRGGASTLIHMLDQRLTHDIPPMLAVTLRAWAGDRIKTSLGRISVLQFEDANVTEALRNSRRFGSYILGSIGSTTLLVKQSDLKKLRTLLAEVGIDAQALDD